MMKDLNSLPYDEPPPKIDEFLNIIEFIKSFLNVYNISTKLHTI